MIHNTLKFDELQQELFRIRERRKFVPCCTEQNLHDIIDNASSNYALLEIIRQHDLCDMCDFSDLDISSSKIMLNCIITVIYKYPQLRSKLNFIGSQKGFGEVVKKFMNYDPETIKKLGVQHICNGSTAREVGRHLLSTIDSFTSGTLAVALNGFGILDSIIANQNTLCAENFQGLEKNLIFNCKSGFWPKGCSTLDSVIYHEIGHLLDWLCDVSSAPDVISMFNGLSKSKIANDLSEYAFCSIAEFIAEGFAESMSNPAPRELARFIAESIQERYQAL